VLPALTASWRVIRYDARGFGRSPAPTVRFSLQQRDPPVFGRLGEISVPASLLVGDADYPPLIEADRQAAARIPGCELTVAPGMDDLPPLREPDLVLRVINSTLSRAGW
jgi:3-oxoadipate enol-lactonase